MTSDEQKIEETDIRISEDETAESPGDREYIYEIVELLVETISIHRDTVMIGGVEYPYQFVKGKLLQVNYSHIQYVLECLHSTATKVRNIKAYFLACLFNAPSSIGNYYRAEVNYHMRRDGWDNDDI